jgi:hypothetical protein
MNRLSPCKSRDFFVKSVRGRAEYNQKRVFPRSLLRKNAVIFTLPETPLHPQDGEGQGRGYSKKVGLFTDE